MLRKIVVLSVVCFLVVLGTAVERSHAAPRIIMLHGGVLKDQRVFLTDWHENGQFMVSIMVEEDDNAEELADRPVVHAALFWGGLRWEAHAADPEKLESLTVDLADQHARIYPSTPESEALFVFTNASSVGSRLRRISSEGLAILRSYGIPSSVD